MVQTGALLAFTDSVQDASHRAGFFAIDRRTGRGLWRFDVPRRDTARVWGFASSPAASDGLVVVGGLDGRVYGFEASP